VTPDPDAPAATLAEAIRVLTRAEIIDYSGHCSMRRGEDSFYINSGASVRGTLTAEDIVVVDLGGTLVEGTARQPLEYHIHSEIYRARADVTTIMHTHPRWSTYLTMTGTPYQPVFGQGALLGDVPVFDSPLSVNTKPAGERVASALGSGSALLLKSHGAIVVGRDFYECFALTVYLEENACRQYMAMQVGVPYVFSEGERQACRSNLFSPGLFRKAWEHYRSKP
jgi:ribulose-5-phosphate 4-epimerase/fuculose-1-phosphate aldolase